MSTVDILKKEKEDNVYDLKNSESINTTLGNSSIGNVLAFNNEFLMKENQSDTVFYIELSNQKMADAICEHTGAKKLELHSCQSITYDDFKKGIHYTDIMKNNIKNLKEALN